MSSVILNPPPRAPPAHWPAMAKTKTPTALSHRIAGFGPRLKAARRAAGWANAAAFARQIGASPQRLANWEAGDHPPPAKFLAVLKQDFGIGADWILSGDLGALSARVLQALANSGAAPDADPVAREVRTTLPDLPDPSAAPAKNRLHEAGTAPPGEYVHRGDVQRS